MNCLILITENPASSSKPAEALRIAAGFSVTEGPNLAIYFSISALSLLDPHIDREDGQIESNLALIRNQKTGIWVDSHSPPFPLEKDPSFCIKRIDSPYLAQQIAAAKHALCF